MGFNNYDLDQLREEVDGIIIDAMPQAQGETMVVRQAMNYAVASGGKRIRPILMYLVYKSMGGEDHRVEPFMAAMEMIHTSSLIHDDLPALDNDNLRRGKPTVHVKFGEDMAILAGDALMNRAYETAAKAFIKYPGNVGIERAFALLANKTGLHGMLGGQSVDVYMTGKTLAPKTMRYIYQKKTAALIEASMMIGAVLAGATEEEVTDIKQAGRDMGLAFQVRDDILDMTSTEEELGKEVGQDARNGKNTYASMYGIEQASEYVKTKTDSVLEVIDRVINKDNNKYGKMLKDLVLQMAGRDN